MKLSTFEQLTDAVERIADKIESQQSNVDLSNYVTKSEASETYLAKTDQAQVDLSDYLTAAEISNNYVEKVSGKGLSTNDYTTAEKSKLAGIDLSNYVEKVSGKDLSTNDFTAAYKTKLDGIAANAQVNVIETVKVNNTALTPSSKAVNIDLSGYLTTSAASSTYVAKDGSKVLSTNDFTAAYKTKLDGIATGANNYTLPNATSSTLGGVKIGSNISVSNGTISLSSANVTAALGYIPAQSSIDLSSYMPKAGGAFTGAVTFANRTWNVVGDDAAIGDHDVSGALAIIGRNGTTRLDFCKYNAASTYEAIIYDGTKLSVNGIFTADQLVLNTTARTTEGAIWVVWS